MTNEIGRIFYVFQLPNDVKASCSLLMIGMRFSIPALPDMTEEVLFAPTNRALDVI